MKDTKRVVRYYEDGKTIYCIQYELSSGDFNYFHREDGPAKATYYPNGNKEYEWYYVYGKLHKLDGPAYIEYYEDGKTIKEKKYFINGKLIFDEFQYWVLVTCAREG